MQHLSIAYLSTDKNTPPAQFRQLVYELSLLIGMKATANLDLKKIGIVNFYLKSVNFKVSSPVADFTGVSVKDKIGLFPILRAGQGMVDGKKAVFIYKYLIADTLC